MGELKTHHVWCNGVNPLKAGPVPAEEVDNCTWCGGNKGLNAKYPLDGKTPDQLQKEYFPDAVRIA
jgi:hypothetical protein